jgi:hypothetical protein
MPPPLLASGAISAGVVVLFLASLLQGLGLGSGVSGKDKLLQFLAPSDLAVAAVLIVAVALIVLTGRGDDDASDRSQAGNLLLLAAAVAALVGVLAVVRAITDLTVAHQSAAFKIGGFFDGLAAALVAAIAALWGLRAKQP